MAVSNPTGPVGHDLRTGTAGPRAAVVETTQASAVGRVTRPYVDEGSDARECVLHRRAFVVLADLRPDGSFAVLMDDDEVCA